ncbi:ABC transporter ATP-binding protein [uncultured Ruminococcus sp.]|uniref:ABC transporter ATP-binding protein n=1 Tax=uncultured Ruminococcus sp. TaxID=165186 RepID=UPI0025E7C3BB|nr:ABC transporter ATP-binding protein [uncultured Ruminococcus sp.]
MIEINNVTMKFEKNKGEKEDFTALDGVSINIPESCIYGFLGSNGAGKSTLMYPQFSEEVFDRLTEKLSLPQNKRMSQFSKGMKRQAVVVAALSCKTKYIMLDEAFDGLDPAMRKIIKTMIVDELMDRDAAMIVSSHNVAEINELCDRAMLIHQGHLIFAGEVDEIKSGFCKLQTSLGSRQMTKEMAEAAGLEVMQFSTLGSVAQMIVRGGAEDCLAKLKGLSPILLEAVPLTLEEIFIYELEVRGYGADILKEN